MEDQNMTSKNKHGKKTIILILAVLFAVFFVWDYIDAPAFWQLEAHRNREAIIRYVAEKYPEAKLISEYYGSVKINPWNKEADYFTYELNGVKFSVSASNGVVNMNGLSGNRADSFINKIIYDDFLIPKGISHYTNCFCTYQRSLKDSVELNTGDDLSIYTGHIYVYLIVDNCTEGTKPSDFYWFYEMYQYWQERSGISDYTFVIAYYPDMSSIDEEYDISFESDTEFLNSTEFFDAFILV
ncbi:MAG: hypothetical protein IJO91_06090 [Oscillospiraceae bacterium]|nr:hypothetical protein [Oscillospiraceae bacterium]